MDRDVFIVISVLVLFLFIDLAIFAYNNIKDDSNIHYNKKDKTLVFNDSCMFDSDCVKVQTSCCNFTSINKNDEKKWNNTHEEIDCSDIECNINNDYPACNLSIKKCTLVKCVRAGEISDEFFIGKYLEPKLCCHGLEKISALEYKDGSCNKIKNVTSVCSNCGNNICDEWENICNCNIDCINPELECNIEGEMKEPNKKCCGNLTAITKLCQNTQDNIDNYVPRICSNCGNKKCEDWENACNCKKDCAIIQ